MITIATADLVGILADCVPFASPDDELPGINSVRLDWDGKRLHAMSTDRYRVAISTWDPDDGPEHDAQDDLFTSWGSGDDAWSAVLQLDDAKDLIKVFKLGPKEGQTPLTVDYDVPNARLKVARSRDTGYSALTAVMPAQLVEFPNVRGQLAKHDVVEAVRGLSYQAKYLADFAKVRQRGALEFTFTGVTGLTHVAIGKRFVGAIMPVRTADGDG